MEAIMTIEEIINEYRLDDTEKEKIRLANQKLTECGFPPDIVAPDERLKYLIGQTIQTLTERDNSIQWKPVVFTKPMQGLNAASLSINDKCKLLIFDNLAMNLFGDIATLIEKLVPNDGLEIIPSLENKTLRIIQILSIIKNTV